MRHIAIAGRAGSGKDYVGDILINHAEMALDVWMEKLPWAKGVRDEIQLSLSSSAVYLDRLWEKPTPDVVRSLLQWWGTDFRRAQDPNYWVNWGMRSAEAFAGRGIQGVVFTDTRFANEAQAVKEAGGIVIKVEARDDVRERRIGEVPHHASEVIDLSFDYLVHNHVDGSDPMIPDEVWHYIRTGEVL